MGKCRRVLYDVVVSLVRPLRCEVDQGRDKGSLPGMVRDAQVS
jgi:hypothetical protein